MAQWIYEAGTNSIEWKCRAIVEQGNPSIENNTSNITVTFQFTRRRSSSYAWNGSSTTAYITIDGIQYSITVPGYNYSSIGVDDWKTIATKVVTVSHDTVGNKRLNVSCSWNQSVQPTSCSVSGSPDLINIPRASSVTCTDANIGSGTIINISRASSSFRHTVRYKFGSLTGNVVVDTADTSIGWTLPTSFYSQVPNSKAGAFVLYCDTYSNGVRIGTTEYMANCFVINSEPTATATFEDVTPITLSLTGDKNKIIKGVSSVRVQTIASAKNSATIKSIEVKCSDGKKAIGNDVEINWMVDPNFEVIVTDSRGFTCSVKKTMVMIEYIEPAIIELNIERLETTSPLTKISVKGNIFSGSFGVQENARRLIYQWREDGTDAWSPEILLAPTNYANGQYTYEANLVQDFDINKAYQFFVKISDKLHTDYKTFNMMKSTPLMLMYKDGIDISGFIRQDGDNIVESGSGINGDYTKYADGTLICRKRVSQNLDITTPWGIFFESTTLFDFGSWEVPFIGDNPKISIANVGAWCDYETVAGTTTTAIGRTYIHRHIGGATNVEVTMCVTGYGRWKA